MVGLNWAELLGPGFNCAGKTDIGWGLWIDLACVLVHGVAVAWVAWAVL